MAAYTNMNGKAPHFVYDRHVLAAVGGVYVSCDTVLPVIILVTFVVLERLCSSVCYKQPCLVK